jgi:tellurite resistance protein TerC
VTFRSSINKWRRQPSVARKVIVALVGGTVLAIGILMVIFPGPAIVFIPLGLAILATEFKWAKKCLSATRRWFRSHFRKSGDSAAER